MMVTFCVPGEPVGKGRPRFCRVGKGVRTYTPPKTAEYEARVRAAFEAAHGGFRLPEGVPLRLSVMAVFSVPKSTSKRRAREMIDGKVPHTKKPDADNVLKAVADALAGVAFADDAAIVEMHIEKRYGSDPLTAVALSVVERYADAE